MELLDVVIRLSDAREVGRSDNQSEKNYFESSFRSGKYKFAKRKWETREDLEGDQVANRPSQRASTSGQNV